MGVQAALTSLNITPVDSNGAFVLGEDVAGMLQSAQTKAQELSYMLGQISSRLPKDDPNIAAISSIINALS